MPLRRRLRLAVIPVVVAVAVYAAWHFHAVKAAAGRSDDLTLYGNVDMREVQLAFQENYRIAEILVEEGAYVRKGQELARLDLRYLKNNVRRVQAVVDTQRHVLVDAESGSRPEEIELARAKVNSAQAVEEDARFSLSRKEYLERSRAVSAEERDKARSNYLVATAALAQAQQQLALAVQGNRREAIEAAASQLKVDEADLATAQDQLADGILRAPADGVVRDRLLQVGDMAGPAKPVITLALMNPIWIRTYVEEPQLSRVRPGSGAWVTTDGGNGERYEGWIGFISPVAEFTPRAVETTSTRTELVYQTRVLVCDPSGALRLGMPATVRIRTPDQDLTRSDTGHACPGT
jgi:HlyD family secretion protein